MTTSKQPPLGLDWGLHLFQIKPQMGFYANFKMDSEEDLSSLSISQDDEETLMLTMKKWQLEERCK
jgi:hypothetical protein